MAEVLMVSHFGISYVNHHAIGSGTFTQKYQIKSEVLAFQGHLSCIKTLKLMQIAVVCMNYPQCVVRALFD